MDFRDQLQVNATLVSDDFVDHYMVIASGEYVKVYLYLLRHKAEEITLAAIADALHHTESDVRRALIYWEKAGILKTNLVTVDSPAIEQEAAAGQSFMPKRPETMPQDAQPETKIKQESPLTAETSRIRPVYPADKLSKLTEDENFSQLLYIAQKFMDKVFNHRECEVFAYLYDGLHMSMELLEYLVEYCVQGGHTSIRYIETVALNWHEKGLRTVEAAKSYSEGFSKDSFAVMKAFGLGDRRPGTAEKESIERWFKNYGFTKELVVEACNRTLEAVHTPSFKYADKILMEWKKAGVKHLSDVAVLDKRRALDRTMKSENAKATKVNFKPANNQFHNFSQRDTDYDALILQEWKEQ